MSGDVAALVLDTGALLALERGDGRVRALLRRARDLRASTSVPAGVVAQAWRGGPRQARVARLLGDRDVDVVPLDDVTARAVGLLCGRTGHPDVVDVSVALLARERGAALLAREHVAAVVTSDPDDLRAVDPSLRVVVV